MKRCEVIRHIEAFNNVLEQLKVLPVVEGGSGKLPPRPIKSITENIGEGAAYTIPLFPAPRAFGPENKKLRE
jgi:hypothetical protein